MIEEAGTSRGWRLLALTHLLMRESERDVGAGGVLRKLKPRLAKLIFES
jgi:hypothetical protein